MKQVEFTKALCASIVALALAVSMQACTGTRPGYETPTVIVSSFRTIPSGGVLPLFEIGLQVINPNRESLELHGASYTVSLEGHELIKGVTNDLPVIGPYSQEELTLKATANLLAGIRLISELMRDSNDTFSYELTAKLDTGMLRRPIRVRDSGEISLGRLTGN